MEIHVVSHEDGTPVLPQETGFEHGVRFMDRGAYTYSTRPGLQAMSPGGSAFGGQFFCDGTDKQIGLRTIRHHDPALMHISPIFEFTLPEEGIKAFGHTRYLGVGVEGDNRPGHTVDHAIFAGQSNIKSGRDLVRYFCTPSRFCNLRDWNQSWKPERDLTLIPDSRLAHFSEKLIENLGGEKRAAQALEVIIDAIYQQIDGQISFATDDFNKTTPFTDELWLNRPTEVMFGVAETLPDELVPYFTFISADDAYLPEVHEHMYRPRHILARSAHNDPRIITCSNILQDNPPRGESRTYIEKNPLFGLDESDQTPRAKAPVHMNSECHPLEDWDGAHFCAGKPSDIAKEIAEWIMECLSRGTKSTTKEKAFVARFLENSPKAQQEAKTRIAQHQRAWKERLLGQLQGACDADLAQYQALSWWKRRKRKPAFMKRPTTIEDLAGYECEIG